MLRLVLTVGILASLAFFWTYYMTHPCMLVSAVVAGFVLSKPPPSTYPDAVPSPRLLCLSDTDSFEDSAVPVSLVTSPPRRLVSTPCDDSPLRSLTQGMAEMTVDVPEDSPMDWEPTTTVRCVTGVRAMIPEERPWAAVPYEDLLVSSDYRRTFRDLSIAVDDLTADLERLSLVEERRKKCLRFDGCSLQHAIPHKKAARKVYLYTYGDILGY